MAEPNYVQFSNQARQQARQAIRGRMDAPINPIDSAAMMDRLQGADVNDFQPNYDPGVAGVLASTGRSRAPVRTAGFPVFRGGDSVSAPTVVEDCPNGQCGVGPGRVVTSMPMMSAPMMGSTSEPMGTIVTEAPSVPSMGDGTDNLTPMRQFAIDKAGPKYGGVTAAGSLNAAEQRAKLNMQIDALNQTRRETQAFVKPVLEADVAHKLASARQKDSEAKVNEATAQAVIETTGKGFSEGWTAELAKVASGEVAPLTAANRGWKIYSSRPKQDARGQMGIASELSPNTSFNDFKRAAFGAAAVGILYRGYEQNRQARTAATEMSGASVTRDPATGKADEVKPPDNSDKLRASRTNDVVIGGLIASYDDLMGQKWPRIEQQLQSDVYAPLLSASNKLYMTANAEYLASLPHEARAEAELRISEQAQKSANATYLFVRSEVARANARAGGGTPDNPDGTWSGFARRLVAPRSSPAPAAAQPAQEPSALVSPAAPSYLLDRAE